MEKKDFNQLKKFDQIFLLGITGSGKSYYAEGLSKLLNKEYYNFDRHWDYDVENKSSEIFLEGIENRKDLIIDAVPFRIEPGIKNIFEDFIQYYKKNNVALVCIFFEDIKKWIKTLISKRYYNIHTVSTLDGNYFITHWYECYEKAVNVLMKECMIQFYNIDKDEFGNYEYFQNKAEQIKKELNELKDKSLLRVYLDELNEENDYDAYYQDIELIDFIGYSKSYETWERIKFYDFYDRTIFDVGCFHGYFSLKVSGPAKKVYAADISNRVLDFCKILFDIHFKRNIEILQWDESKSIPDDVNLVLCLNVFHHFKNKENFMKNIRSGMEVIFEIEEEHRNLIEKYFIIKKSIQSHRENRVILYAYKKL